MPVKKLKWALAGPTPAQPVDADSVVAHVVGSSLPDGRWFFSAEVWSVGNDLVVGSLSVRSKLMEVDPPGSGVTSAMLRSISPAEIIEHVRLRAPEWLELATEWASTQKGGNRRLPAATRRRIVSAMERVEVSGRPTGSAPHPDEFYRRVALAYLDLDVAGVIGIRRKLAERITAETDRDAPYTDNAAKAWLRRCEEKQLLIFHGQGRKGAVAGPRLDPRAAAQPTAQEPPAFGVNDMKDWTEAEVERWTKSGERPAPAKRRTRGKKHGK